MKNLTVNDFPIGQQVGAVWRIDKEEFKLEVGSVSSVTINKKGTKVTVSPKIFRRTLDIEEFSDFRKVHVNNLVTVDTPLLLSDTTIEYLKDAVKHLRDIY